MTVPSRAEAARLLLSLDPPDWHVRHSRAVAEVAGWLALRIERRRVATSPAVDRRLVEAAALLHDVGKTIPRSRRPTQADHGEVGAAWLADRGFDELGEAVALHPVTRLLPNGGPDPLRAASIEARIVAYADKRAGQRLEPMAARFAHWDARHPDGWAGDVRATVWRRAVDLERDVCGMAAIPPAVVGRLRWTGAAFTAATAAVPA